jgi:hypothetical protein
MEQAFEITRTLRRQLDRYFDDYTIDQLNAVLPNFNNNLIWNIAHIIVVQQMLVYNLSGLPMQVSPEMVAAFKRGTRPELPLTENEIHGIRSLLFATIDQTETDFHGGVFRTYRPFETMTGYIPKSAADAIAFNCSHEALHLGMMMSIRKFV